MGCAIINFVQMAVMACAGCSGQPNPNVSILDLTCYSIIALRDSVRSICLFGFTAHDHFAIKLIAVHDLIAAILAQPPCLYEATAPAREGTSAGDQKRFLTLL